LNQHELGQLIRAARGEIPADLILANARIVNTLKADVNRWPARARF
jgi:adenine deaminase